MARRRFENGSEAGGTVREALVARLRFFRQRAGLQQTELARLLGLSRNSVSSWEKGVTRPDIDHVPRLCAALGVTPSQLFGEEEALTDDERRHLAEYRRLDLLNRRAVDGLTGSLLYGQQRRHLPRPDLIRALRAAVPLAGGAGDFSEWAAEAADIYLHRSPRLQRAAYVFTVNGTSMEPDYPDGSLVAVEAARELPEGAVGAFQTENALYIKQYRPEGLASLNPRFPLMRFEDYEDIRLIGRVIGPVRDEDLASPEEIELFRELQEEA